MKTDNKLSKKEKIKLLEKGIKNLENGSQHFICTAIMVWLGVDFKPIPEILKYKPKKTFTLYSWFRVNEKGKQKRIAIMKKVIEDIKNA